MMVSSTSTGMDGGITVVTLGEMGAGTQEETQDETSQGHNGVFIGCKGTALTLPGGGLMRVKGSIPSDLWGVTLT